MASMGFLRNIYFQCFAWPCCLIWFLFAWLRYFGTFAWNSVSEATVDSVVDAVDFNVEFEGVIDVTEIIQATSAFIVGNCLITILLRKQERQRRLQWIQLWTEYTIWKQFQQSQALQQNIENPTQMNSLSAQKKQTSEKKLSSIDEFLDFDKLLQPITQKEIENAKEKLVSKAKKARNYIVRQLSGSSSGRKDSKEDEIDSKEKEIDAEKSPKTDASNQGNNEEINSTETALPISMEFGDFSQHLVTSLGQFNPLIANAEHAMKLKQKRLELINSKAKSELRLSGKLADEADNTKQTQQPPMSSGTKITKSQTEMTASFAEKRRARSSSTKETKRLVRAAFTHRTKLNLLSTEEFSGSQRPKTGILHFFAEGMCFWCILFALYFWFLFVLAFVHFFFYKYFFAMEGNVFIY